MCCNRQLYTVERPSNAVALDADAAGTAASRRCRHSTVRVHAVAATERPAQKVTEQAFDLPKGSRVKVCFGAVMCGTRNCDILITCILYGPNGDGS